MIRELGAGLRESLLLIEGDALHGLCVADRTRARRHEGNCQYPGERGGAPRARGLARLGNHSAANPASASAHRLSCAAARCTGAWTTARRHESRAALKRLLVAGFGAMQAMMFAPALFPGAARFTRRVHARFAALGGLPGSDARGLLLGAAILRRAQCARSGLGRARDGRPGGLAIAAVYAASLIETLRGQR